MQVNIPTSEHPTVRTVFTMPDGSKLAVESERGAKTASVNLPEGVADENVRVVTYFMSGRTMKGEVLVQEAKPVEPEPKPEPKPEIVMFKLNVPLDPKLFTFPTHAEPEVNDGPEFEIDLDDEEVEAIEKELEEPREGLDAGPVYSNKPADE